MGSISFHRQISFNKRWFHYILDLFSSKTSVFINMFTPCTSEYVMLEKKLVTAAKFNLPDTDLYNELYRVQ